MADPLTVDFDKPIPLFPLGACLLLPHAVVPVHIYEPRYRRMVEDALDGPGLIALAVLTARPYETNHKGDPAIRDHVCVGYIGRHEKLPDGRYNLLVQGVCRARVVREVDTDTPYRQAMLEPTETGEAMEIDLDELRQRLIALLEDEKLADLTAISAVKHWLTRELPTSVMIDLTVLTLCQSTVHRYDMLAEPDAAARGQWLERHLRDTRRTLELAGRFGPALSKDGLCLN